MPRKAFKTAKVVNFAKAAKAAKTSQTAKDALLDTTVIYSRKRFIWLLPGWRADGLK